MLVLKKMDSINAQTKSLLSKIESTILNFVINFIDLGTL